MARLYSDEQFPRKVSELLRTMGHDVLTVQEAGNANLGIPDDQVLAFAVNDNRAVITLNREDFIRLHSTIHTFQGSEKRVIILSTKLCRAQDSVSWINKRPNLLNVAVSRAKELFILVGNLYKLEKGNLTRQLVEHIREQGDISEYKFESEIPQQQPGSTLVYDCDHFNIFQEALDQAEEELIIVTPWIRGNESKRFIDDVVSALERGVKVTVVYGNKGDEENDNNDSSTESNLRELFSEYSGSHLIRLGREIHIESRGTNEKILVCDSKFAILGSWSWLSHPYRKQCTRSLMNPKVQIRRETSIQLSDPPSIENIKARIYQLFR